MGVLYECPCVICSRYPSGGRYVSRATFYRHGGSNMALSRAKRRRTDDAAAEEEPSALDPGHDGCVEEEAGDGAHATGGDEQDEETDGGVLDRTVGGSVGAWAGDGRGSDSGGSGDGSVKSDGSDDGERLEGEDLPLDLLQNYPLSDGGDDNEAGEDAEDPRLRLQQAHQPLDDVPHGAPDNEHVGQSTPASVSTNGVALSPEAFADMVQDFVAFDLAQESTYLEKRWPPCGSRGLTASSRTGHRTGWTSFSATPRASRRRSCIAAGTAAWRTRLSMRRLLRVPFAK